MHPAFLGLYDDEPLSERARPLERLGEGTSSSSNDKQIEMPVLSPLLIGAIGGAIATSAVALAGGIASDQTYGNSDKKAQTFLAVTLGGGAIIGAAAALIGSSIASTSARNQVNKTA